ncbi:squamous cell carcinoma antigen recognized by T-cells 3-like isoform X2 [Chenopodium quinoa]|uniref:squamous cell carcinoma antigen recognized by T-cells 3-like isoform X2 n=1 Tax=Chenopodium quinoa TaxID=63459 RepID=UPI000B77071D|nr:squamous cell carcinoma antigen recognized by T-cells 3-like isoform X2 [Chenopodium quinoa]
MDYRVPGMLLPYSKIVNFSFRSLSRKKKLLIPLSLSEKARVTNLITFLPFKNLEMAEPAELEAMSENPEELNSSNDGEPRDAIDATAAKASTDNFHSDSDSDDENEAQQAQELKILESELSRNPSNYDAHVQYIKLLRKMGEIDKLREARESMSQIFPLTPTMWQEWAKDETTLCSGPEAVPAIEKIYERGVSDYLSVPLWCDYLNFVQEHDLSIRECSASGVSKARNLFERALTAAGLHFCEGSKIWEAYKEFEQAICLTIDDSDIEGKEKQIQRVRNIFHRQLSVPLADMNSTLLAYKVWEVQQGNDLDVNSSDLEGISSHVASAYKKALEMCDARNILEEQISKSDVPDTERIPLFKKYLKFEESAGDPARVQILYERLITEFPICSDLWIDYTRYLEKTLKVGNVVNNVISRATSNCPWIGELWVRQLLCLERAHASEDEISLVFEKALQCSFSSYEEYLELFLTRIDGLRRRISVSGELQVLDYAVIRDVFQRASDYLSLHLKGTDALLRLHAYWVHLELTLANDIVAARGVWESLLKISGTMLEAWQGYIKMEIDKGNLNEARSLYRRCYTKRFPGSGSQVSPRLEELQVFDLQQDSKTIVTAGDVSEHPSKKNAREKRKPASNLLEDQSPSKRLKEAFKEGTKKIHNKDVSRTATVEETEANINKMDSTSSNEQLKKQTMHGKAMYTDQCTAFISNLDPKANYEDLRKFFSDVGGVQSIRILKHRDTGKSRGLAYVDFSDDAHLDAAVGKNRQWLLKKKLSIARSDPSRNKNQSAIRHEVDRDGSKIPSGDQPRTDRNNSSELSVDQSSSSKGHDIDRVQLKGKNTFAVPRNVRPLGFKAIKPKDEGDDEKPKSNDEFRNLLLKK